MPGSIRSLRRLVRAGRSDAPGQVIDHLGRVGLVGYGLVHLVVAWLAIPYGVPGAPADAGGAVGAVAQVPGGPVALVLGALGLAAFAVWQLTAAAIGFRWVHGGERVRKRVGAVAKAIATAGLAIVVVESLVGATGLGGDPAARLLAASLLALPAGRVALGGATVVLLVLAVTMTYTGVRRTFLGDLDLSRVGPAARATVAWLGVAGHLSRALALGMVGWLTGRAALASDPARAGGIAAALRALGSSPPGAGLVVLIAAGIAAFGLFCLADAATRRA